MAISLESHHNSQLFKMESCYCWTKAFPFSLLKKLGYYRGCCRWKEKQSPSHLARDGYLSPPFVLPHSRFLGFCEDPSHPAKLYFLLICPQLLQLFLIKLVLLIKIYLKLQINLFHQIKLIYSKNWIILFKCLTRQYPNKNKNLIIQN